MSFHRRSRRTWAVLAALMIAVPWLVGQGCPVPIAPGAGAGLEILSPTLNQAVPPGGNVTIVYNANVVPGTSISAFYDRDGVNGTGDEVVFATNLASGQNRFVQLATSGLAAGELHVGLTAGSVVVYSPATLTLGSGTSAVTVVSPSSDLTVGPGAMVPVRFTVGQGVSNFTYTVFYDTDGSFNGDEITIATGSGVGSTSVNVDWNTSGLATGTYHVGVTLNSSGAGASTAYASGTVMLTSGAFAQLLAPLAGSIIPAGTLVEVEFAALDPADPTAMVRLFYDIDGRVGTGDEITIGNVAASAGSTLWDTTAVQEGSYFLAAQLLSTTPPITSYTDGPVNITGAGSGEGGGPGDGGDGQPSPFQLNVTAPSRDTTVFEGQLVPVRWSTSAEVGEATVELFYEPDFNADGEPDGELTRVVFSPEGLDATEFSHDWNTGGVRGQYFVGVTLIPFEGAPVTKYAPGMVIIQPFRFWVGQFGTRTDDNGVEIPQTGLVQGALFKGHNFGDNLGSSMMVTEDYDGDTINEIVLASQFGKPFFFANEGRGAGEAYFIYGQSGRLLGSFEVNETGQDTLEGVLMTGIIPNPNPPTAELGLAGNSIPYDPDGLAAEPYATEGLRTMISVPDQDGDGLPELAFGFPWCNSYSLSNQHAFNDALFTTEGRLENNGHFLRGGVVIISSRNSLLINRAALSRHFDRVIQLQRAGQAFQAMAPVPDDTGDNWARYRNLTDVCPDYDLGPVYAPEQDTVTWPCLEGFWQDTDALMDPPRLADPFPINSFYRVYLTCVSLIDLEQVDPPPLRYDYWPAQETTSWWTPQPGDGGCGPQQWGEPGLPGFIHTMRSGFYTVPNADSNACDTRSIAEPFEPYGCRVLGQTTSQQPKTTVPTRPATFANLFGSAVAISGDFMLIGAPHRTVQREDVLTLPEMRREQAGEVYMWQLNRNPGSSQFPWSVPGVTPPTRLPAPHTHIMEDVGYSHCEPVNVAPNSFRHELMTPFHIVGAGAGDRVGATVASLGDINGDGVDDFALGGQGTNSGRGAVYVIYRRQPEVEGDYLLERLQIDTDDLNRLNGLMISGRIGENLGSALAGGGDYNADGSSDLIVGSPLASAGGKFHSGEVFILFGGKNLLNPAEGITIPELRDQGDGMVLGGEYPHDEIGTTVAHAGDINADGVDDLLISAPNASPRFDSDGDGTDDTIGLDLNGDRLADDLDGDGEADDMEGAGLLYIVLGGEHLTGTISLDQIGTAQLPGFVLVGRKGGDHMGGGLVQNGLLSRGVSGAGDFDGDGRDDIMVSSVLADPDGKTNAGEVYMMYGFAPPTIEPR